MSIERVGFVGGSSLLRAVVVLSALHVATPFQCFSPFVSPGTIQAFSRAAPSFPPQLDSIRLRPVHRTVRYLLHAHFFQVSDSSTAADNDTAANRLPTETCDSARTSADVRVMGREVGGRVLEVRAATPEEMTKLLKHGQWLPNFLQPLSNLCAGVLYGAEFLHAAVSTDFQRRYGNDPWIDVCR